MLYPALLPLMCTPRLPVVDWTDAPADLNGLVRFAERRNLVSAHVPSHFKRTLPAMLICLCFKLFVWQPDDGPIGGPKHVTVLQYITICVGRKVCVGSFSSITNKMQRYTIYLFISVKCSARFRRFLRPSSGAQNCIYSIGYFVKPLLKEAVKVWQSTRCCI